MNTIIVISAIIAGILVVMILIQIISLRMALQKYEERDYSKQALSISKVSYEYDRLNTINLYSVTLHETLYDFLQGISDDVLYSLNMASFDLSISLPIRSKNTTSNIQYLPKHILIMPLQKTVSSNELYRAIASLKVTYLATSNSTFRVIANDNIQSIITKHVLINYESSAPDIVEMIKICNIVLVIPYPELETIYKDTNNVGFKEVYNIVGLFGSKTSSETLSEIRKQMDEYKNTAIHCIGYRV